MLNYYVEPRYTAGSGAMLNEAYAEKIGREERQAHGHALEGLYGPEEQAKAERLGLRGIVQMRGEVRRTFEVHDQLTGETWIMQTPKARLLVLHRRLSPERADRLIRKFFGEVHAARRATSYFKTADPCPPDRYRMEERFDGMGSLTWVVVQDVPGLPDYLWDDYSGAWVREDEVTWLL